MSWKQIGQAVRAHGLTHGTMINDPAGGASVSHAWHAPAANVEICGRKSKTDLGTFVCHEPKGTRCPDCSSVGMGTDGPVD